VLSQQSLDRLKQVMVPKVWGTWHLHTLIQALPLDFFVCFSSMASLLGSPGQGNYAAANAFMDALVYQRRALGLPGLSINWGPWSSEGMAAQHADRIQAQGIHLIAPAQGRQLFARLFNQNLSHIGAFSVDWPAFVTAGGGSPLLEALVQQKPNTATPQYGLRQQLTEAPVEARLALLREHVRAQVAQVLGWPATARVDFKQAFSDLGMDSLMIVELRNHLQSTLDLKLVSTLAFDYPTVEKLCSYLAQALLPANEEVEAPSEERTTDLATLDQLSEDELGDLLDRELRVLTGCREEESA
jgi:acyl carrier protein